MAFAVVNLGECSQGSLVLWPSSGDPAWIILEVTKPPYGEPLTGSHRNVWCKVIASNSDAWRATPCDGFWLAGSIQVVPFNEMEALAWMYDHA